jgi:hypothetical protein
MELIINSRRVMVSLATNKHGEYLKVTPVNQGDRLILTTGRDSELLIAVGD